MNRRTVVTLDTEVHKAAKVQAAINGTTLSRYISDLIRLDTDGQQHHARPAVEDTDELVAFNTHMLEGTAQSDPLEDVKAKYRPAQPVQDGKTFRPLPKK